MTNDTTPATDEQIVTIKNKLVANSADPARKLVMFAVDTDTLESLIARIEADKEKIEQLEFEAEWADSKIKALQAEITTWKQTAEQRANDCVVYQTEITALKTALDELLDWVNGERRTSDDRLAEIESMLPSKGEV